jgi:hypothetical protein
VNYRRQPGGADGDGAAYGASEDGRQARKDFFFEKKKQKTFDYVEPAGA